METGAILITEPVGQPQVIAERPEKIVIYTRVSPAENKDNLDGQAKRLQDYAAKGYAVAQLVKEIGSGVNDSCPQWLKLLTDPTITLIVVEHKDRLTRFGFNYFEQLLKLQERRIEVIRPVGVADAERGQEDLVQDFASIVTSFCARLDGQRRSGRRTERLIAELAKPPVSSAGPS